MLRTYRGTDYNGRRILTWPWQKHVSYDKVQGPDEYMRAKCICGARFQALDGRFGLSDFERWEREHRSQVINVRNEEGK